MRNLVKVSMLAVIVICSSTISFAANKDGSDTSVVTLKAVVTKLDGSKVLGTEEEVIGRMVRHTKDIDAEQALENAKNLLKHPHNKKHGMDKDATSLFSLTKTLKKAEDGVMGIVKDHPAIATVGMAALNLAPLTMMF
jgi:hypothetical protein